MNNRSKRKLEGGAVNPKSLTRPMAAKQPVGGKPELKIGHPPVNTERVGLVHKPSFEQELRVLLNKYGMENGSNTPDFVLADYLLHCLINFGRATNRRDVWREHHPLD